MSRSSFKSGRTGRGRAFVSDRSGSHHAELMRLTSYALLVLGLPAIWFIVGAVGKSYDEMRLMLGRPFPAIALVAFAGVAVYHMMLGAQNIIDDYVHDERLKAISLDVNKWLSLGVGAVWVLAIMMIAAPR